MVLFTQTTNMSIVGNTHTIIVFTRDFQSKTRLWPVIIHLVSSNLVMSIVFMPCSSYMHCWKTGYIRTVCDWNISLSVVYARKCLHKKHLELTFSLRSRRAKKWTYIRVIDDVQMYTALQTFAHTPNFTIIVTDIARTLATNQIKYKQTKSTTIHKRLSTHRNTLIRVKKLIFERCWKEGVGAVHLSWTLLA